MKKKQVKALHLYGRCSCCDYNSSMSKRGEEHLRKWNEKYHPERLKEKPKQDKLQLRADLPFMDQLEELALAGDEQAEKELMEILSCPKCVSALSSLRFRPGAVQLPEEKGK